MSVLESIAVPNVLYLSLMAGLWFSALAVVTPGTGVFELLAFLALAFTGAGTLVVPINGWAFAVLVVGAVLFILALRGRREALWLGLSAVVLSLGSAYLFGVEGGAPAVHPLLAVLVSLLTLSFFWVALRKALVARRARPVHNPSAVIGQIGEVRTLIEPTGSVYVGGELWTARSDVPIPVGTRVRVRSRDGLVLTVEPVPQPAHAEIQGG